MRDELEAAAAAALRQATCSREDGGAMSAVHAGLVNLAWVESMLGRHEVAIARLQEVLAGVRRLRGPQAGYALGNLAQTYAFRADSGDIDRAQSCGREAWKVVRREERATWLIFAMAIGLSRSSAAERAALLLGYTDKAWAEDGMVPIPFDVRMRAEIHSTIRDALGEERTAELLAMGAEMSDERAAEVAFGSE